MENIVFFETGGLGYKKVLVNGYHVKKPFVSFCLSGVLKGTDARHDVSISNKWSYFNDEEKEQWKDNARKEIVKVLMGEAGK